MVIYIGLESKQGHIGVNDAILKLCNEGVLIVRNVSKICEKMFQEEHVVFHISGHVHCNIVALIVKQYWLFVWWWW